MQDRILTYSIEDIKKHINRGFVELVAKDGVYRVTETPVGIFSVKVKGIEDLTYWREGFAFSLPLIPTRLLGQIYAFFRDYARHNIEVMAQLYWDPEKQTYLVHVPKQRVSGVSIGLLSDDLDREVYLNHICVMDIHSHHNMRAFFSSTDDEDEIATRLYSVIGSVSTNPEIKVRYSLNGIYRMLRPEAVFEKGWEQAWNCREYPSDWKNRVMVGEVGCW